VYIGIGYLVHFVPEGGVGKELAYVWVCLYVCSDGSVEGRCSWNARVERLQKIKLEFIWWPLLQKMLLILFFRS